MSTAEFGAAAVLMNAASGNMSEKRPLISRDVVFSYKSYGEATEMLKLALSAIRGVEVTSLETGGFDCILAFTSGDKDYIKRIEMLKERANWWNRIRNDYGNKIYEFEQARRVYWAKIKAFETETLLIITVYSYDGHTIPEAFACARLIDTKVAVLLAKI